MKTALITGVTGQDGAYLAEFLLDKGYEVHGIVRRASTFNRERIEHLHSYENPTRDNLLLHYGDMTDSSNLIRIIKQIEPQEITIWLHNLMYKCLLMFQNTLLMLMV